MYSLLNPISTSRMHVLTGLPCFTFHVFSMNCQFRQTESILSRPSKQKQLFYDLQLSVQSTLEDSVLPCPLASSLSFTVPVRFLFYTSQPDYSSLTVIVYNLLFCCELENEQPYTELLYVSSTHQNRPGLMVHSLLKHTYLQVHLDTTTPHRLVH